MASQVSHIIYAQKYFEKHNLDGNGRDEFILGCVFPDMRRIDDRIKRKDTHLEFDPLDLNFKNLPPFEAGWKFHLYCDMKREDILNKYNFYNLKYATEFFNQPAKMLEDELIYGEYNNWEKLYLYFSHPPFIKTRENIMPDAYDLWYAILSQYIKEKPSSRSIEVFLAKQPKIAKDAKAIVKIVDKLRENDKVTELLKKVKDEIV